MSTPRRRVGRRRIYLLSPANCAGARARGLLSGAGASDLARRLRAGRATLGETFAFVSSLYFRGKLAYARTFAHLPPPLADLAPEGALVITPGDGLRPPGWRLSRTTLKSWAQVRVGVDSPGFRGPFERDARALCRRLPPRSHVVLLGSIASPKYAAVLLDVFGPRVSVPAAFVGLGDMSRGSLMLRSVRHSRALDYVPLIDV